ncbi:hypothetical protein QJQ45_029207 [Haematococcus lacustris]|nr:hypothetical protein QJQ45_029207 [Haematococcus lacustris]
MQANIRGYEEWKKMWGPFKDTDTAPPAWGRLITVAEDALAGKLPEPLYSSVKTQYLTAGVAAAFDQTIRDAVFEKGTPLKPSQVRKAIDEELKSNKEVPADGASQMPDGMSQPSTTALAAVMDMARAFVPAIRDAQTAEAARLAAEAEAARLAAEQAAQEEAARQAAAAAANSTDQQETKSAKRARLLQEAEQKKAAAAVAAVAAAAAAEEAAALEGSGEGTVLPPVSSPAGAKIKGLVDLAASMMPAMPTGSTSLKQSKHGSPSPASSQKSLSQALARPPSQQPIVSAPPPQQRTSLTPRPPMPSSISSSAQTCCGVPHSFFQAKGLCLVDVPGDGNCFFRACCVGRGITNPEAHVVARAKTVHLAKGLVQLHDELKAAGTCPPALDVFMEAGLFVEGERQPMALKLWYPYHLEKPCSWTNDTAVALHIALLGVPLHILEPSLGWGGRWYAADVYPQVEGVTPEQLDRLRPPEYAGGQPGDALYLLRANDNHYLAIAHADGRRMREGDLDLMQLADEINTLVNLGTLKRSPPTAAASSQSEAKMPQASTLTSHACHHHHRICLTPTQLRSTCAHRRWVLRTNTTTDDTMQDNRCGMSMHTWLIQTDGVPMVVIPDSQGDNPLKRPRDPTPDSLVPNVGEKPGQPVIPSYFDHQSDDDKVMPDLQALVGIEEHDEHADVEAVKATAVKGTGRAKVVKGKRKSRGRGGGGGRGRSQAQVSGSCNTVDVVGTFSSKCNAEVEANTPPVIPEMVWQPPTFEPVEPVVMAVESKEQRIAFARHVEDVGFGVFRLPQKLQPSRFPKLVWALLFLVVQFAEVIFKEGTFDEHGNPTKEGGMWGTDFGTGQRLQMSVTTTNDKGKLSDSSEIEGLTTDWARMRWDEMRKGAGDKADKLTRQLQMAVEVATRYLSMLMPFIEEIAGGNIRGGTIIGNDYRKMKKVVTYGSKAAFHYNTYDAYRLVEAQVAHMDVQPDARKDKTAVKSKLAAAMANPDAIQRYRDGMVFIIAIQTFYLLLVPGSVRWVMIAESHAEAVFGGKATAAQKAAYEAALGGMEPMHVRRLKVEAGSCVCIRGYLLHAGDKGQADTISVRIHFYSSLGFQPGETTYVHGLGKLFCSNVMPTVRPRDGWPLAPEFEVYRNAMVKLPAYTPPPEYEYEVLYNPLWDADFPTKVLHELCQMVEAAAMKIKAEAEQERLERGAKKPRIISQPPQRFD